MHLHFASIRKIIGVRRSVEILPTLYDIKDIFFKNLQFTPRGKEVFKLILRGYTIENIAVELGMSYSGVRRHKEKMILANDCSSMQELIGKYYAQEPLYEGDANNQKL